MIIDDVLATRGTLLAAANLVKKAQSKVVGAISLLEITFLQGAEKLESQYIISGRYCKSNVY
jgi:adenine phosphoribosyltransferase